MLVRNLYGGRFDVSAPTLVKLEELRRQTGATDRAEVIGKALAVYDFLWQAKAAGEVVIVRAPDGSERKFVLE